MRFEFDRGRLLDLLVGHAIYNDATVAIRELLQNAIDAVRFRHHLDSKEAESTGRVCPAMGIVRIHWDNTHRILIVEDNGIGMDLDIVKFHLMRVGSSFYDTPQFATEHNTFTPISRFGIGILTCFMISDDIEIVTTKSSCGYRVRMSSVHADYLIRELASTDPMLASIRPHGTKVTITIRDGVDLNKRTIEDILRYWIILPECTVEYTDNSKPTVTIGFDTPSAALAYHYKYHEKKLHSTWHKIEMITKKRNIGGGTYDMAIAVQADLYPEKTFAMNPDIGLPAVCIEGIRVSDHLPGFEGIRDERLTGLMSVRGVRGLRTTVSRSGLEQDKEYLNLGCICADILFEHINDEINRISQGSWKPLSRASTAGKWLSSDLRRVSSSNRSECAFRH